MSRWGKIKNTESNFDPDFRFLLEIDPAFCHWQPLASEWWGQQTKWLQTKRAALTTLFIDYIHGQNLNKHPTAIFDENVKLQDLKIFLQSATLKGSEATKKHDIICDFLDWTLREKLPGLAEQCGDFKACDLRHPFKRLLPKKRVRKFDPEFNFLLQLDPAFDEWRAYGEEWISQQVTDVVEKNVALTAFFVGYIQGQHLDKKPEFLFTEKNILPDLATVLELSELKESVANIRHDHISDFLEWVLYEKLSSADQNGYWSAFPHLRHPFARRRKKKLAVAFDDDFQFLLKVDPAFEQWRALAAEWTIELKGRLSKILRKGTNKLSSMEGNRISLSNFFINYMHRQKLEKEPSALFGADTRLPDLAKALSWHLYKEVTVKNYRCAISDFLEWVLREKLSTIDENGYRIVSSDLQNPFPRLRPRNDGRSSNIEIRHVLNIDPRMEEWRSLAAEWLSQQRKAMSTKRDALESFLLIYAIEAEIERNPFKFLLKTTPKPSFFDVFVVSKRRNTPNATSIDDAGTRFNNAICDFIDWVIKEKLSAPDDNGQFIVPHEFHNPFRKLSWCHSLPSETLKMPLPFRYIKILRSMLAEGPTFRDWKWAQEALKNGTSSGDWFMIDQG